MLIAQKIAQVITLSSFIFGTVAPGAFSATAPQESTQKSKPQVLLAQSAAEDTKSTVEDTNFSFQLPNCQRVRDELVCGVKVTNLTDTPQDIRFNSKDARVVDLSGNVYSLSKIQMGEEEFTVYLSTTLTPGIPTKINYHFTVPQEVNRLAGIEFQYRADATKNRYRKVGIRDISIGNPKSPKPTAK